jgi:hypothetical protein
MGSFGWDQVLAFRMSRNRLVRRAPRTRLVDVAGAIGGIQAQVASAAELSLWARVNGLRRTDVREALWKRRSLVKTWAMRGTLHLLPANDLPTWTGALADHPRWRSAAWLRWMEMSADELDAAYAAIGDALGDEPMTRDELAEAVAPFDSGKLRHWLRSGWGTVLKPVAFSGGLCFGPDRGRNVTFVRPDRWLATWEPVDAEQARREVVRRYLAAFGPATHQDFARWWGIGRSMKELFATMADELATVDVEGRPSWMLRDDAVALARSAPTGVVRLLPNFDAYLMASYPREVFLAPARKDLVFRTAGWVSPVVLIDGRVEGVWGTEKRKATIDVTVSSFRRFSTAERAAVATEVDRLGRFLDSPVTMTVAVV